MRLSSFVFCAAASLAWAGNALAQNGHCEFFEDPNRTGASVRYNITGENVASQPWSNVGRRFEGANLKVHAPAIYRNLESVRVVGGDTPVALYVYSGDHFDGTFQVVRAPAGGVANWNFGSMRNKTRSIICQQEPEGGGGRQVFTIPMSMLADVMTAQVHDMVDREKHRFYNHDLDIRQGRLVWSTGHELCRSLDCVSISDPWRRKYWDFLRFSYKSRGRLKADGKVYTISVDIWIEPYLQNGTLRFRGDGYKVDVSNWIWHNRIRDGVKAGVADVFPTIGEDIEDGLRDAIVAREGPQGALVMSGNKRLVFGYSCNSDTDRVGYPNYSYTGFQVDKICGGTTPEDVVAPSLRLVR